MKSAAKNSDSVKILLTDQDTNKAMALAKETGAEHCPDNIHAAQKGDYIFLAVKPQVMGKVLQELAPVIMERLGKGNTPVVVSMAAGWNIDRIQSALCGKESKIPHKPPVVRIMPNMPAMISQGVIAVSASSQVHENNLSELEKVLSFTGIADRIEEKYLDAVTGLSGSGPAFVYLFIEALADGGVRAGLPREKALRYAAQTVLGSAAMVLETGRHPAELKDMVTSPSGTTIAGVSALENGKFRGTVINAVETAWRRAVELGSN